MSCSILLLDPDRLRVRPVAAPSLPEEYSRALEGAPIGPRAGSCGTAAYRGQPVIVTDIETDPLWEDYRELARAHGLRACWSTPILNADGQVLGTFAMYFKRVASPEPFHRRLIQIALHVAAIAIGKDQRERELFRVTGDLKERVKELTVRRLVSQELLADRSDRPRALRQHRGDPALGVGSPRPVSRAHRVRTLGRQERRLRRNAIQARAHFSTSKGSGTITIVYLDEVASRLEGGPGSDPFLVEEHQLLDSLAEKTTIYLNRAHAEAALEESEQRYRLINLATNDAVWDWDIRNGTLWWNDGVETLFAIANRMFRASWPGGRARAPRRRGAREHEPARRSGVREKVLDRGVIASAKVTAATPTSKTAATSCTTRPAWRSG